MDQPLLHPDRSVNSALASFSLLITGFLPFMTDGYLWTCISPVIPVLKITFNETYVTRYGRPLPQSTWTNVLLPLITSSVLLGGLVGGVSTKFLVRFCSRKLLMQIFCIIMIASVSVTSVVGKLTLSYEAFIIGRFFSGASCGVCYNLAPMILAEMSTWHQQGYYQSISAISMALGCVCGPVFAQPKVFGTYQLWPCMISITALPSIVYLISSIWIPNSPYYIYRTKGREFALIELAKLRRGSQTSLLEELDKIEAEIQKGKAVGIVEMLTTKQYRHQLFAVIFIAANLMLTGIDNIMLYANQVFIQAGVDPKYAMFATIGVFVLQFIVGLFGVKFVDIFGARKVNITSGILIVIAYTLYTISQATLHLYPSVMPYLAIFGVGMFLIAWSGGINPATFALLGELTIERTRATALSYGSIFMWSFAWLVGFVPPYLHEYLGAYSMTIWLGFAIVFVIYQILYIPETKGRSSKEIQLQFK